MGDSVECGLCYEAFSEDVDARVPRLLPCGHTFCHECLDRLVRNGAIECPNRCGDAVNVGDALAAGLARNFALIDTLRARGRPTVVLANTEIGRLEEAKRRAIEDEDFDLAKQLKVQIAALASGPTSAGEVHCVDLGPTGYLVRVRPDPAAVLMPARRPTPIVVLDRSPSMGGRVQWAINVAVPAALDALGYQDSDAVVLITFDSVSERVLLSGHDPTLAEVRTIDVKARGRSTIMADAMQLLGRALEAGGAFNVFAISDGFLHDMPLALKRAEAAAPGVPQTARVAFALFRFFTGKPPDTRALAAAASLGTCGPCPCADIIVQKETVQEAKAEFISTAETAFGFGLMGKHMALEGPALRRLPNMPAVQRLQVPCGQDTVVIMEGPLEALRLNGQKVAYSLVAERGPIVDCLCASAIAQLRLWLVGQMRREEFVQVTGWFKQLAGQRDGALEAVDLSLLGRARSLRHLRTDTESPLARVVALSEAQAFVAELLSKQQGDFLRSASVGHADRLLVRRALGPDIHFHDGVRHAIAGFAQMKPEDVDQSQSVEESCHVSYYGGGEYADILRAAILLAPIADDLSVLEILQVVGGLGAPFSANSPQQLDDPWSLEVTGLEASSILAESDVWAAKAAVEPLRLACGEMVAGVLPLASCGPEAHAAYCGPKGMLRPVALMQLAAQLRGGPPEKAWGWDPHSPPFTLEDGFAARSTAVLKFAAERAGVTQQLGPAEVALIAQVLVMLRQWASQRAEPPSLSDALLTKVPLLPYIAAALTESCHQVPSESNFRTPTAVMSRILYCSEVQRRLHKVGEAEGLLPHAVAARREVVLRLLAEDVSRQRTPVAQEALLAELERRSTGIGACEASVAPDHDATVASDATIGERLNELGWLPSADCAAGVARVRLAGPDADRLAAMPTLTLGKLFFGGAGGPSGESWSADAAGAAFCAATVAGVLLTGGAGTRDLQRVVGHAEARAELETLLRQALQADYRARLQNELGRLILDRQAEVQRARQALAGSGGAQREMHFDVQSLLVQGPPPDWGQKRQQPHISCVFCGHLQSGKSTAAGRLLFELGVLTRRDVELMHGAAQQLGKASSTFAFTMDRMKEERERGLSISLTKRQFYTDRFRYTLLDSPGHRDFVKSTMRGISQADVGVLMVPADSYMEAALSRGSRLTGEAQGQSRQSARFLNVQGVKQLVVCITKMDAYPAAFSQARFEEAAEATKLMLAQIGWKREFVEEVPIIPISAWTGDNLVHPSVQMPWWSGALVGLPGQRRTVVTLAAALNEASLPKRQPGLPLRVPVTGIFKIRGVGDVVTGRIAQGSPKVGDEVAFLPSHTARNPCVGRINSCEMHHTGLESPTAGDIVGFNIKGLPKANMPHVGDVMVSRASAGAAGHVKSFTAQVMVLSTSSNLRVGYKPTCFVHSLKTSVRLTRIVWKQSKSGREEDPHSLRANEMAEVVFTCKPMALETEEVCEAMARLVFMEGHDEVMLGKVVAVERQ